MAKVLVFDSQTFPVGTTTIPGTFAVTSDFDSADIFVLPRGDWVTVSGRTIKFTVEQSLDGGTNWQHWFDSGDIRTGPLPRVGVIVFGVTAGQFVNRVIRVSVLVTGAPITCGMEIDITRRTV